MQTPYFQNLIYLPVGWLKTIVGQRLGLFRGDSYRLFTCFNTDFDKQYVSLVYFSKDIPHFHTLAGIVEQYLLDGFEMKSDLLREEIKQKFTPVRIGGFSSFSGRDDEIDTTELFNTDDEMIVSWTTDSYFSERSKYNKISVCQYLINSSC